MGKTEYETSEQRCSTPTPTNSDAPNGAEPNSEAEQRRARTNTTYGKKRDPNRGEERPTTTRESSLKNLDQDGLYKGAT